MEKKTKKSIYKHILRAIWKPIERRRQSQASLISPQDRPSSASPNVPEGPGQQAGTPPPVEDVCSSIAPGGSAIALSGDPSTGQTSHATPSRASSVGSMTPAATPSRSLREPTPSVPIVNVVEPPQVSATKASSTGQITKNIGKGVLVLLSSATDGIPIPVKGIFDTIRNVIERIEVIGMIWCL